MSDIKTYMRITPLILTIVLNINICFSQKENNIWYFGDRIGLNFNVSPPALLYNSAMSTNEGCSSVGDSAGRLLFYTDGITVWNKNHQVMDNGNGLKGHPSSTQSSVTVKKPASTTIYYIFNADVPAIGNNGIHYSVVDMALNGGLGKVIEKNTKLYNGRAAEKLTCVKDSAGSGFWIIFHPLATSSFYAYHMDKNGVDPAPVTSHTGSIYAPGGGSSLGIIGYLKASPNSKKLVSCMSESSGKPSKVEVFDINNATGKISGCIQLDPGIGTPIPQAYNYYGCSFSHNSKLLYITSITQPYLVQYDVSLPTPAEIEGSLVILSSNGSRPYGALQIAPDGKIYTTIGNTNYLSVINNPDIYGVGCDLKDSVIQYTAGKVMLGLPNFIDAPEPFITPPVYSLGPDTFLCPPAFNFRIGFPKGIAKAAFKWNTGSTDSVITVSTPGIYWVEITTPSNVQRDSIKINFYPDISGLYLLPKDTILCTMPATLSAAYHPGVSYLWNTGDTGLSVDVTNEGTYWVEIYTSCSKKRDSIRVKIVTAIPFFEFGPDTVVCGTTATLRLPVFPGAEYIWSTGDTTTEIKVDSSGLYSMQVKNYCSMVQDFIRVKLVQDSINEIHLGNDTLVCGDSVLLDPGNLPDVKYRWSTGDTARQYLVDSSGVYYLEVTTLGCNKKLGDTIKVEMYTSIPPALPNDTDLCLHVFDPVELKPGNRFNSYLWHDGSTNRSHTAFGTGIYFVETRDTCNITYLDTFRLTVEDCNCELYVPTAFTPNDDGANDRFVVREYCGLSKYHLRVYSRWGELLFETFDPATAWDGTYKNYPLPDGIYLVMINYGFVSLPAFPDYKNIVMITR
ncbi:MAG TPA: gliding motility-associated C-terminal domain-containing protein [Bacteroidia bacterium]|nr:gliding motility-associated C-terminal domain-containing protein [Bacteroidia bacterium]